MCFFFGMKRLGLLSAAAVLLLSSCSWLSDWPPAPGVASETPPPVPGPPQMKIMQTADATWMNPAPLPAPQEHMVAASGGEEIRMSERVAQLEREIADLRQDMALMLPALTRLSGVQESLASVAGGMQPTAGYGQAPPVPPVRALASAQAQPVSLAPSAALPVAVPRTVPAQVTQLRVGEHPGRTRLVFDTTADVSYSYEVDNGEKILRVSFPGASWAAPVQSAFANSPMVVSYQATPDGNGGTTLAIQLQRNAQVALAQGLPAASGVPPRVVVDLAAAQ